MDSLLVALELKNQTYITKLKQPHLGNIFLMNNYRYIFKFLQRELKVADLFIINVSDNSEHDTGDTFLKNLDHLSMFNKEEYLAWYL